MAHNLPLWRRETGLPAHKCSCSSRALGSCLGPPPPSSWMPRSLLDILLVPAPTVEGSLWPNCWIGRYQNPGEDSSAGPTLIRFGGQCSGIAMQSSYNWIVSTLPGNFGTQLLATSHMVPGHVLEDSMEQGPFPQRQFYIITLSWGKKKM